MGQKAAWRVLHLSGLTSSQRVAEKDRNLFEFCCGITAVVNQARRSAVELARRN